MRNGNLGMKTSALMFGLSMAIGMFWKKKKLSISWRRNHNVITLNQTLFLVILIYIDNSLLAYYLGPEGRFLFTLEMMRIIFIENLAFKFLFPLLLIRSRLEHCSGQRFRCCWIFLAYNQLSSAMTSS